ncbi:MAG TPA: AMP-binding protein [Syntrophales bacterium]|nr:AMP-binding protein [Syntrophales bacterium]HON22300.1 AMP-binding protein [Syntrophales bacterium]HOU76676.1 AMP-binding protein [Syntrophales bacterium]HPC31433.1 AMP-binding protein [Syntrophales bacterium]HQG33339.1 AMP-binding protein [Syntrophales bacterium]
MADEKPWLKYYGDVPASLDYPRVTMYEALMRSVERNPEAIAYDFMGYTSTYRRFAAEIDQCARALYALGLRKGERITISMPTTPQGIICFYGANKIGAVASMIHPLSTAKEIAFYLRISKSRFALTIDAFYNKFREIREETPLEVLILTKISDYLEFIKKIGFYLTKGRKIPPVPADPMVRWWKETMSASYPPVPEVPMDTDELAVILYSGGTTGTPKGIMLSNMNFISEGMQVSAWGKLSHRDAILAILPIFHGFGLGVCVNAAFMGGGKSILVPQFNPEIVAKLIKTKRPTFVVGVPTLFEALCRNPVFQNADLSCLKATFSGADTLPRPVKEDFEALVKKQGGKVKLLEGYGLTEAVTAIMAMPLQEYREGSVGVPFPDMLAKIVRIGTTEEEPPGTEGELCLHGPAVMMGYLDQPEETAATLKRHGDGRIWLHTGDIAVMDSDGFFYFKLRLKRMIKSSGMNVYPAQVEDILYQHPEVKDACVIGVPDEAQVQRVKAFVVLKDMTKAGDEMEKELISHCRGQLIKWSCPREIEFRESLPCTLVGKIAYNTLEQEEIARLKAAGKYSGT